MKNEYRKCPRLPRFDRRLGRIGDMMGLRSMVILILAIGLAGCSPYPDAIPGCQSNEELFGATDIQSGTFRGNLAIVVWTDLAYAPAGGSISSASGASASATQ